MPPPPPFAVAILSLSLAVAVASLVLTSPSLSKARQPTNTTQEVSMIAPAMEAYTARIVRGDLWKRPDLSPRDRSIVTLAALIARNHTIEMPYYLDLALDSGVKPREISEIVTHLAFYSGWGNAVSVAAVAEDVFEKRPQ